MFNIPEKLEITGGTPINGTVEISGAKNSVMCLMAAALLTREKVILRNVPFISDVLWFGKIMRDIGVEVFHDPYTKEMHICAERITTNVLPAETSKRIRTSYYFWGALLARFSITKEYDQLIVANPGGCKFGTAIRKFDFHIHLLKTVLGTQVEELGDEDESQLIFTLPEIVKTSTDLSYFSTARVSHGATINFLLSSVGTNNIAMLNAIQEPEVADLIHMLNMMGREQLVITGEDSTGLVKTQVGEKALLKGVKYIVMSDRLEAASYALLASITGGEILISNCDHASMKPFLTRFNQCADVSYLKNGLFVSAKPFNQVPGQHLLSSPYPGDETDLHQVWAPLLSQAKSPSVIIDPIWINRTGHIEQLNEMDGNCSSYITKGDDVDFNAFDTMEKAYIDIRGRATLTSANVTGPDLRGTIGLIFAACAAEGTSQISEAKWAIRGYPNLVDNLRSCGVQVTEVGHDEKSSAPLLPPLHNVSH
jgi:UDP-N-acetylglucosamine 1-carboxyvinyltransferase